jgi:hypothetical protein
MKLYQILRKVSMRSIVPKQRKVICSSSMFIPPELTDIFTLKFLVIHLLQLCSYI